MGTTTTISQKLAEARLGVLALPGLVLSVVLALSAAGAAEPERPAPGWGDFALSLSETLTPLNHQRVGSGWTVVQPIPETVMGVGSFYAPPLLCPNLRAVFDLVADGEVLQDRYDLGKGDVGLLYAGGFWKPDRIVRKGTFHQLRSERLISVGVQSELIPLYGRAGFLLKVTLVNRTDRAMTVAVRPSIEPGGPDWVSLDKWGYHAPPVGPPAHESHEGVWVNPVFDKTSVRLTLFDESRQLNLPPQGTGTAWLALVATKLDETPQKPAHLADWEAETAKAWQDRLDWALARMPRLESDIPGLADYYRRSVLSGLVCIWENPNYVVNPYVSTSGMDGGAMCAYLWDLGAYAPDIMTLLLGEKSKPILERMAGIDLEKYYAFTPNGDGVGCSYSYSPFAFTRFVWGVSRHAGPDQKLFDTAKKLVLDAETKYPERNGLLDYGVQHNLLEMRGRGYEHFVPSPNVERAWCLDRLADLGQLLGHSPEELQAWRTKAAEIRTAVKRELWDPSRGWFKCLYPDGGVEYVYSIQAFDVLRAIPDDPEIRAGLLAQLRPGAFLADCGVQSVSREDAIHFETVDTDWSGGGAYVGDGADLALTLYEIGEPERAWDVLRRYFWMGKLLYYPQEMLADRPAVPAHKRANCIGGLTGAQAVVYGLAGFDPRPDGSLRLHPQPPKTGRIALRGFRFRDLVVDVEFQDGQCRVVRNGAEVYRGPAKPLVLTPSPAK